MKSKFLTVLFIALGTCCGQEFVEQKSVPELFVHLATPDTVFSDLDRENDLVFKHPREINVYKYEINIELHNSVEFVEFESIKFKVFSKETGHNVPFFVGEFVVRPGDIEAVGDSDRKYIVSCYLSKQIIDYYENRFQGIECNCYIKIHKVSIKNPHRHKKKKVVLEPELQLVKT